MELDLKEVMPNCLLCLLAKLIVRCEGLLPVYVL